MSSEGHTVRVDGRPVGSHHEADDLPESRHDGNEAWFVLHAGGARRAAAMRTDLAPPMADAPRAIELQTATMPAEMAPPPF